ncbi:hypothetical protein Asi03nite_50260 [Actinoplanes siamensis]|uniref:Uncharacterized protein n=1 Tax=Actinoplanes siamensis TaxID=1223317 RepID=A0A919NAR7_9ACTN|nr:hypothetical protein Asi03nite_50260 [Actinoplanes siamensis]
MTRTVRARRAGVAHRPLYARMLCLRHLTPGGLLCFVFLEGAISLGVLLALAELVSWWGVLVLPMAVAVMVKFNDLVAGWLAPPAAAAEPVAARAAVLRERHVHRPHSNGHAPEWPTGDGGGGFGFDSGDWQPRVRTPVAPPPVDAGTRPTGVVWFPPDNDYGRSGRAADPSSSGGGRFSGVGGDPEGDYGPSGDCPEAGHGRFSGGEAAPVVNVAPVRRPWTEELDVRQQMARQSAVRRYE